MFVEITPRNYAPPWASQVAPILTLLASLLLGSIPILAVGADPVNVYSSIFISPFSSVSSAFRVLNRTVPLLLIGLAVYLPLKAGVWNVGGDGQFYLGAIVTTWVGLNVAAPAYVIIPLMIGAAMIFGGLWAFFPALLRAKYGINEIITTLLMTFIGIQLNLYMVLGPLREEGGFPASETLPDSARVPDFGEIVPFVDVGLNISVLISLLFVAVIYVLVKKHTLGFEVDFVGENPDAAQQSGISTFRVIIYTMVIGGAIAGVAGMLELSSVQGRLQEGMSPGYGFTAVAIALLGREGPLRVVLAALVFGLLTVGGNAVAVQTSVSADIVDVISALVILFILASEFLQRFKISVDYGGM